MQEIFVVYLLFWGWSAAESSLTKLFLVYNTYSSICTNPVPNPGCVFPASMAACNLGPSLWTHLTRRLSTTSGYKVSCIWVWNPCIHLCCFCALHGSSENVAYILYTNCMLVSVFSFWTLEFHEVILILYPQEWNLCVWESIRGEHHQSLNFTSLAWWPQWSSTHHCTVKDGWYKW
jgi:hypothetical protein